MKIKLPTLSYASVTATLALVVALSGSSYAAVSLARGSVGTAQLKNSAVTTAKLHKNAVVSSKVKDGSIGASDLSKAARSMASWSDSPGNTAIGTVAAPTTVESLDLPRGKYMVIGSTGVTNVSGTNHSVYCHLYDGTAEFGVTRAFDEASQRSSDATVTGVVSLTAATTTVSFRCWADSAGMWIPAGSRPSILAVSVTGIDKQ